jgi:murein L,D-transpeptidase YcbB/YkuD
MPKFLLLILLPFLLSCNKEVPKSSGASKSATALLDKSNSGKIIAIDTAQIHKFKSDLLTSFYQSNNNKTVWLSSDQRKILITALSNAGEEGLNPKDYTVEKLNQYEEKENSLTDEDWIDYDLTLTNSLQKYISHLTNGKLDPKKLYSDWDLASNKIDINKTIATLQKSDSLAEKIEKLKPNSLIYIKLKKALITIDHFSNDDFKKIEITNKIIPNDSSTSIIDIKKRLIYWKDLQAKDSLTTIYDSETVDAVKKFQTRHGLITDGIVGKGTIEALNFSKKQRKEQIIANLERWKWFPRAMGNEYIIINIPDYKLTLIKNTDTIRTHKVIVGRAERKTPILSSKLTKVIFNPTWTVPPTILREDVIPAVLKNRSYLSTSNIKIYDKNGNVVSPDNWELSNAKNYRYVQTPGTYNSLGMVKLIFPNRFSVYLHDTNHRDFFTKTNRSLSSGCVRVENPLELTEYLLDDATNWDLEKITETLKNRKTKNASIKKDVFFHLLYWTAWSDKSTLFFRDDIYNLDTDLYNKLGY